MRRDAWVPETMNAVVFYSNTGQSRAVAEFFAERLKYAIVDIWECKEVRYHDLVLVFPVHCQNIPDAVKAFLERVSADNLTVIATYGKMCCGNVLHEIQQKYPHHIVAGAYVPTKHSYIDDDEIFCDFDRLMPVIEKIKQPSEIVLPRLYKNPLADVFPVLRSRLGLRICRSADCSTCGACTAQCPVGAIRNGMTGCRCIRCVKCVTVCPKQALTVKMSLPMKLYLRQKKANRLIIYI